MVKLSTCIAILNFVSIIILWRIQNAEPTQQPSCTFPRESIACKIWNHTNMDCSARQLSCVPRLSHIASLKLLDLSHNKLSILIKDAFCGFDTLQTLDLSSCSISSLQGGAFNGLHNLLNLDLYNNIISFINGATFAGLKRLQHLDLSNSNGHRNVFISSPFKDLNSLKTIKFQTRNISSATFTGLTSLQELQIRTAELLLHDPFGQLPSLVYLSLVLETCNFSEKIFYGLNKLEYLYVSLLVECRSINVDICPLVSQQTLEVIEFNTLNLTNNCFMMIPMNSLLLNTRQPIKQTVLFEMLNHLTSLYWGKTDSYTSTQALNLLNSPPVGGGTHIGKRYGDVPRS